MLHNASTLSFSFEAKRRLVAATFATYMESQKNIIIDQATGIQGPTNQNLLKRTLPHLEFGDISLWIITRQRHLLSGVELDGVD